MVGVNRFVLTCCGEKKSAAFFLLLVTNSKIMAAALTLSLLLSSATAYRTLRTNSSAGVNCGCNLPFAQFTWKPMEIGTLEDSTLTGVASDCMFDIFH
jgi:hypothetical protein